MNSDVHPSVDNNLKTANNLNVYQEKNWLLNKVILAILAAINSD